MLAIIDGDVLCHIACKSRWESKINITLNSKGEASSSIKLDSDGKREALEYTKEENEKYLRECWDNFNTHLNSILNLLYCDDYLMAVKGDSNFRSGIDPEYKNHRKRDPSKQNIFIPTLRKLAIMEDIAIAADNCEADDLIRIWAEQSRSNNIDFIICSIDKDLKCIPGKHFNVKSNELVNVSFEDATRQFYEQLLMGDPVDNIKGVLKVGPVTAKKLLADCNTEEEFQEIVVEQYMKCYDEEWYILLLINGRLLYIKKHDNDYFNPRQWNIIKNIKGESFLPRVLR